MGSKLTTYTVMMFILVVCKEDKTPKSATHEVSGQAQRKIHIYSGVGLIHAQHPVKRILWNKFSAIFYSSLLG